MARKAVQQGEPKQPAAPETGCVARGCPLLGTISPSAAGDEKGYLCGMHLGLDVLKWQEMSHWLRSDANHLVVAELDARKLGMSNPVSGKVALAEAQFALRAAWQKYTH